MKRVTGVIVAVSMAVGLLGVLGCGGGGGTGPADSVNLSDELIDSPPEVVLGNLFSLEFLSQRDQYWNQYQYKRVEWVGVVYGKQEVDDKVAVSLDYACQSSPLAQRNLHAGVIVYLVKDEAENLNSGETITYAGHLYRRLSWDKSRDAQELQFKLGYGGASAVTIEDGSLIR